MGATERPQDSVKPEILRARPGRTGPSRAGRRPFDRVGRVWTVATALAFAGPAGVVSAGCTEGDAPERSPQPDGSTSPGPASGGSTPPDDPCAGPVDVGETPLTRVSDDYVRNAVTQVFGVPGAFDGPPDEKAGPFDANITAAVAELSVEAYAAEASRAAAQVVQVLPNRLPCAGLTRDRACARSFVDQTLPRLFRRRIDSEESSRWLTLYDLAAESGGFDAGVAAMIEAWLQAPSFLYLVEEGEEADEAAPGVRKRTDWEMAARIAAFVWSSVPDRELVDAARAGALGTREEVEAQVRRLLASSRADGTVAAFFRQLMGLTDPAALNKAEPHRLSTEVAGAMTDSFDRFVVDAFRSGSVRPLFVAETLPWPSELMAFHGLEPPDDGAAFHSVDSASVGRPGLLTLAWPLAQHASDLQASVVRRGKVIREHLLCTPIPDPPPDANSTDEVSAGQSRLERVQSRLQDPDCASCHRLMDPIGVALDGFDAAGRGRTPPEGTAGELVSTDVDGPIDGAWALSEALADSRQVRQCLARQWLRFGLGRLERPRDRCSLQAVTARFEASGFDPAELMVAVATSDGFRYVRRPQGGAR